MPDQHTLTNKIIREIEEALAEFGRYTYYDKGAREVIHMTPLLDELRALPKEELRQVLLEVHNHKHGDQFVTDALCGLQDLPDDVWDFLMEEDTLARLF